MNAIILIQISTKNVSIQMNNEDVAVNINLEDLLFTVPTLSTYHQFGGYEDRYTKTLVDTTKKLKRVEDIGYNDMTELILSLFKIFKVKEYQINVDSDYDCSDLRKYTSASIVHIIVSINRVIK